MRLESSPRACEMRVLARSKHSKESASHADPDVRWGRNVVGRATKPEPVSKSEALHVIA